MSVDCHCPEHRNTFECEYPGQHGSFEVFYSNGTGDETSEHGWPRGWYWWSCQPGCLPDSDPVGPFNTAKEAYLDCKELS